MLHHIRISAMAAAVMKPLQPAGFVSRYHVGEQRMQVRTRQLLSLLPESPAPPPHPAAPLLTPPPRQPPRCSPHSRSASATRAALAHHPHAAHARTDRNQSVLPCVTPEGLRPSSSDLRLNGSCACPGQYSGSRQSHNRDFDPGHYDCHPASLALISDRGPATCQ